MVLYKESNNRCKGYYMKLIPPDKGNLVRIKKLYRAAFPRIERKPFRMILRQCEKGEAEIFSIESNDGVFVGLAITVKHNDIVMLDYFAIHPSARGKGAGSRALQMLKKKYADCRFILEIESVEEPCRNAEVRKKRREFYLRNGMKPAGYTAQVFFTVLEVLTAGDPVSFEEYRELYRSHLGDKMVKKISLKQ